MTLGVTLSGHSTHPVDAGDWACVDGLLQFFVPVHTLVHDPCPAEVVLQRKGGWAHGAAVGAPFGASSGRQHQGSDQRQAECMTLGMMAVA